MNISAKLSKIACNKIDKQIIKETAESSAKAADAATKEVKTELPRVKTPLLYTGGLIKVYDKKAVLTDLQKQGFPSIEDAFDTLENDHNAKVPDYIKRAYKKSRIYYTEPNIYERKTTHLCYGNDDQVADMFPWNTVPPFKQGDMGSCWFLSSGRSLSGKADFKNMIKTTQNGFEVQFPGAKVPVSVSEDELQKCGVKGSSGMKILETAANKYYTMAGKASGVNGYYGDEGLRLLTGSMPESYGNISFDSVKEISSDKQIKKIKSSLNETTQNPDNYAIVSSTGANPPEGLIPDHAYSILPHGENKFKVINPHDSSKAQVMNAEEILDKFAELHILDLNNKAQLSQ